MPKGRLPQDPRKVPLMVKGKLRVRNEILGGASEKLAGICLAEMQQVFLCFKKFSFNEEACSKEITNFKTCYNRHITDFQESKKSNTSGKTNAEQITRLLQRFPERKKDSF